MADPEGSYRRLGAGAVPGELEGDQAAMAAFIALIRADARLYIGLGSLPVQPVGLPLSTFSAVDDAIAAPADMSGWPAWTTASHTHRDYQGDHFYILKELPSIVTALVDDVMAVRTE